MAHDHIVIRLERIDFAYPNRGRLFAGLDLCVSAGDRMGIVGGNGSGKTTLFHLIMGLVKHGSGRLEVMGRKIQSQADYAFVRQNVGFLFQNSEDQLFSPTVGEDVAFGPLNLGLDGDAAQARVGETLEMIGLSDYADRITYALSAGEKRLAALATVLAMRPQAMLLDEPESGLDPKGRREVLSALKKIGGTQVLSSHDMEFIRAACSRVVLLDEGRLCATGATDDILGDSELMSAHGLEVPHSILHDRCVGEPHGPGPHGRGDRPDRSPRGARGA